MAAVGCSWDGCGKPTSGQLEDHLNGGAIAYCPRHLTMARDGFLHHVTPSKGAFARSVGGERFRWVGGDQVWGEYGTQGARRER